MLYEISKELAKVRKVNTPESRFRHLELLEQSINLGSNFFLAEYVSTALKLYNDNLIGEKRYNTVVETAKNKLMEMSVSERTGILKTIVANEDEDNLSRWKEFVTDDNNTACWHDILLFRYFMKNDDEKFTQQRKNVLFEDISKTLFLINHKSAPSVGFVFGSENIENCLLVIELINSLSKRDDDVFLFQRIIAQTRLAATYIKQEKIDEAHIAFERLKSLLAICERNIGKTLTGSVGLFEDFGIVAEQYKYENCFFEIEVMLRDENYRKHENDQRLADFSSYIKQLHAEIDPFCYISEPDKSSLRRLRNLVERHNKDRKAEKLSYAFAVETEKGFIYEKILPNCMENSDEEKRFVEMLRRNSDTQIKYIVGFIYDEKCNLILEMPSHRFRMSLCDLDRRNLNARLLLRGFYSYMARTIGETLGSLSRAKYED